jgi:hypothetical protein
MGKSVAEMKWCPGCLGVPAGCYQIFLKESGRSNKTSLTSSSSGATCRIAQSRSI